MGQVGIRVESMRARRKPESLARLKQAARKLFVERGYDATRPQDIAREAGLGHGTFYLHYADKRACFLSFVDDARRELDAHLRDRRHGANLEERIAVTLEAMYDYADRHPGLLRAALTDARVIDAGGEELRPLLTQWGEEWAKVIGEAVVGALYQTGCEAQNAGRSREALINNLTIFLSRALRPD